MNMVFTANESIILSTQLNMFSSRTKHSLASKMNGGEQRSYEVSCFGFVIFSFSHQLIRIVFKISIIVTQDAVTALNHLHNNASTIKRSIAHKHDRTCRNVGDTERCLSLIGISMQELDQLSVIHVAGTKGKVWIIYD